jgi:hypothetical protein
VDIPTRHHRRTVAQLFHAEELGCDAAQRTLRGNEEIIAPDVKVRFEGREIILDNLHRVMVSMDDLKNVYEPYDAAPEARTAYSPGTPRTSIPRRNASSPGA